MHQMEMRPKVLGELLRARSEARPDDRFCYVKGVGFTFGELERAAAAVAAGLSEQGVSKGDRVAFLVPNRPEFFELVFGIAKLGAIAVPLNVYLKGEFLRHQLVDSAASVLVVDESGRDAVSQLSTDLPDLHTIVELDSDSPSHLAQCPGGTLPFASLRSATGSVPDVEVVPEDPMAIIYTSGTTGYPKGCVLPHGYYERVGRLARDGLELRGDDAMFAPLPLFHLSGGVFMLTGALVAGIPVHYSPQFSSTNFLREAAEVGATVVLGVGAMSHALLTTTPGPADRAHGIRTMMVAPLGAKDQEKFDARFGIDPWAEVYGQTECMPITLNPVSAERDRVGCGLGAPDLEVALLDEDLGEVKDGDVGEICLRPSEKFALFDRYWNNAEATVKSFRGLWYHTGDSAYRRPSGQLVFVDRKSDTLRRKGENVSSLELEAAIRAMPKVSEVAVHAVPADTSEDDIKACVVLRCGEVTGPEEMFQFFRDNLPYFAMPRYVEVLTELPVNAMNRVMKHVLKERANDEASGVWDLQHRGLIVAAHERR